jgi:rhomboid family GlyGly-CTERM serine protease
MPNKADTAAAPMLHRLPWITFTTAALAIAAWFTKGAFEWLSFDRALIAHGQIWRVFTAHWVHFSSAHLLGNLIILLGAGGWLEYRDRPSAVWTILVSPLTVSIALLAFEPSLRLYAGSSGIASGLLMGLAAFGLRKERSKRWLWCCVVALFAGKVALDLVGHAPMQTEVTPLEVRSLPLAHLVGAATGTMIVLGRFRQKQQQRA